MRIEHTYVGILGDLQGPKIRVSKFAEGPIYLSLGDKFTLDAAQDKDSGTQTSVGIDYKALPEDVNPGDVLLLDDGRVQLIVDNVEGSKIHTTVSVAGKLSNNKGINRQGGGLSAAALTDKDKEDIKTAAAIGVLFRSRQRSSPPQLLRSRGQTRPRPRSISQTASIPTAKRRFTQSAMALRSSGVPSLAG